MSRRNRDRRKWKCARCGNPFDRKRAEFAIAHNDRLAAEGLNGPRLIHACGCGAKCYEEGDRLRLLTPAEELAARFENEWMFSALDAAVPLAEYLGSPVIYMTDATKSR